MRNRGKTQDNDFCHLFFPLLSLTSSTNDYPQYGLDVSDYLWPNSPNEMPTNATKASIDIDKNKSPCIGLSYTTNITTIISTDCIDIIQNWTIR